MARNLNDLANSLEKRAASYEKRASDVAVKVATELLNSLLWRTPVDTSTALSNWQVSFDAPLGSFIQAYVPGYLGYTAAASITEAFNVGKSTLALKKPGQTIYISNNAPYIRDLENGTSKQSPPGAMVAGSMLIARKYLRTIKF